MSLKTNALKPLLCVLALLPLAAPALRAETPKEAVLRLLDAADQSPDPALRRRAQALRYAVNASRIEKFRYDYGAKGEPMLDGCVRIDCSGFVHSTVGLEYKLPGESSKEMFEGVRQSGALRSEGALGDLIFFHHYGDDGIFHVGINLRDGTFLHIDGRRGDPVKISRLSDYESPRGAAQKYTWNDLVAGYGDLDGLPAMTDDDKRERIAQSSGEVRIGGGEPGGVLISPDLVMEAAKLDPSGALDAMEAGLSEAQVRRDGTVDLPDGEIPPGFDD